MAIFKLLIAYTIYENNTFKNKSVAITLFEMSHIHSEDIEIECLRRKEYGSLTE